VNQSSKVNPLHTFFVRKFWMVAAVLWTGGVLALALSPSQNPSWLLKTFGDKVLHGFAFTVGGLLWAKTLESLRPLHRIWAAIVGACVALTVGVAIELLQRYVPGRSCDLLDFWADVIGVLPSVLYMIVTIRRKPKSGT
jgi:VanZ family protein